MLWMNLKAKTKNEEHILNRQIYTDLQLSCLMQVYLDIRRTNVMVWKIYQTAQTKIKHSSQATLTLRTLLTSNSWLWVEVEGLTKFPRINKVKCSCQGFSSLNPDLQNNSQGLLSSVLAEGLLNMQYCGTVVAKNHTPFMIIYGFSTTL